MPEHNYPHTHSRNSDPGAPNATPDAGSGPTNANQDHVAHLQSLIDRLVADLSPIAKTSIVDPELRLPDNRWLVSGDVLAACIQAATPAPIKAEPRQTFVQTAAFDKVTKSVHATLDCGHCFDVDEPVAVGHIWTCFLPHDPLSAQADIDAQLVAHVDNLSLSESTIESLNAEHRVEMTDQSDMAPPDPDSAVPDSKGADARETYTFHPIPMPTSITEMATSLAEAPAPLPNHIFVPFRQDGENLNLCSMPGCNSAPQAPWHEHPTVTMRRIIASSVLACTIDKCAHCAWLGRELGYMDAPALSAAGPGHIACGLHGIQTSDHACAYPIHAQDPYIMKSSESPEPVSQQRRGGAAVWATNPVLAPGEIGIEMDTALIKIGDGSTDWASLPYLAPPHPGLGPVKLTGIPGTGRAPITSATASWTGDT